MQGYLTFIMELNDPEGEIVEQRIPIDAAILQNPAQLQLKIQNSLVQFAIGGCIKMEGRKFVLVPAHRIHEITCDPPSIIEGSLADLNNLAR